MIIGRKILSLEEVTSTNDVAKEFAEQSEPEGLVIFARAQTKGRGRRGRGWTSHKGKSVVLSALVRPSWPESETAWLGVLGGVATALAVRDCGANNVQIKWPNDVLVGGKKIAGILVEPRLSGGKIEFGIIGIGLNVLQNDNDWDVELAGRATSLSLAGCKTTVESVGQRLIQRLDECYAMLNNGGSEALFSKWSEWSDGAKLPVLD